MNRLVTIGDLGAATALLTRLPSPGADHARGARAAWAWPFVGGIVGGAGALTGVAGLAAGLPEAVVAGMALTAQVLITGALHEDGLADLADGLGGGRTPERRLEIMRDSRIGAFGAVALVLTLGLRWSLAAALLVAAPAALLAAGALSRAGMALLMAVLPSARPDGLSAMAGRPGAMTAALAGAVALGFAGLAAGPGAGFVAALGAAVATAGMAALARDRLGGQTGDVLGATQQVAEVASLAALTIVLV